MARTRMEIRGMTCEHCALAVERALEQAGVRGASVDFRRGFAEFDPSGVDLERARASVREAGYEPGEAEAFEARRGRPSGEGTDYDLAIVGSGAAAFAAAIQAAERGARVAMVGRSAARA